MPSQSDQPSRASCCESTAAPIKLGYLFDFVLPQSYPKAMRRDLTQTFELMFHEGLERKVIDRPVEIVFREVESLPKGTIKSVIDAYEKLVQEGCLAVFDPSISDNGVPITEMIEPRFHVPAISVCDSEDWLGPGYLVARKLEPDGMNSHLVGRFGQGGSA